MNGDLYSIRMHAERNGRHLSGAERIVERDRIDEVMCGLVARAMGRTVQPEEICVTIEPLQDRPLRERTALNVVTINVRDVPEGRFAAKRVLQKAGVSPIAADTAVRHLGSGAGPSGKVMRGAMIVDSRSGERLEQDPKRGVRASRFDWSEAASQEMDRRLAAAGLTHFRTKEALALATKVVHGRGIVAELCWSDEPDYTAGYVASLKTGYVRFPQLKGPGDVKGGRVFFVDRSSLDLDALTHYLQTEAVLVTAPGTCRDAVAPDVYFSEPASDP